MDFELSQCANTDCPAKLFKIGFDTDLSWCKARLSARFNKGVTENSTQSKF